MKLRRRISSRIEAELTGSGVHDPLDKVGGLGATGAAVGAGRVGVGEDRDRLGLESRDPVGAGPKRAHPQEQRAAAAVQVGADVADGLDPQRQHPTVTVERRLGDVDFARGRAGWSRKSSIRVATHFNGRPSLSASVATTRSSRYIPPLTPKPPPTSGATTRMRSSSSPSPRARPAAQAVGRLARGVDHQAASLGRADQQAARLQRHRRDPVVRGPRHDAVGGPTRRRLPRRHGFAARGRRRCLARPGGAAVRRARALAPADSPPAAVVLDVDQTGGVLGRVAGVGDDHRDRLADEADRVGRERQCDVAERLGHARGSAAASGSGCRRS